jgi:hypothetical protein
MKRFLHLSRIISIVLLSFTGANALVAGFLFMLDPSGQKIGMTTNYLAHSPFSTYLIPGITLFVVIGLLNILIAFLCLKKYKHYPLLIIIQGVLLLGWIILQVFWVRDFNALHLIMLFIGLLLLVSGMVMQKNRSFL